MRERSNGARRAPSTLGVMLFGLLSLAARGQDVTPATVAEVQQLLGLAPSPEYSMPVWVVRQDTPALYRRNPAVWTGSRIDLTGKAVWNSASGHFGTTAISPRHVVSANHAGGPFPVGTVVRFVDNENRIVERSVVSSVEIGQSDVDLSTLDQPLPPSVHWYKVMPEHWFLRCSKGMKGVLGGLPCVVLDDNTQSVLVKDLAGFTAAGVFVTAPPSDPLRKTFTRELTGGDSGSPMFILVGDELVLDGIYHWNVGGPELSSLISALDEAMRGSRFQVTVCNLDRALQRGVPSTIVSTGSR